MKELFLDFREHVCRRHSADGLGAEAGADEAVVLLRLRQGGSLTHHPTLPLPRLGQRDRPAVVSLDAPGDGAGVPGVVEHQRQLRQEVFIIEMVGGLTHNEI